MALSLFGTTESSIYCWARERADRWIALSTCLETAGIWNRAQSTDNLIRMIGWGQPRQS
jgi:hypothetical protein